MKSVYKFALDLHEMIAPIRIDAKVGDTARELEISFLERGIPWAIPAGTTATISDGTTTDTTFSVSGETVTWNECFVVNEDKITYRLNGAFTASEGARRLEFKLIGTDGVLYTSTFMLNVYGKVTPNVDPESLTPTTLDDLDKMLQGLQTALEDIDSLKERGYLITGLTVNANHQLVVTMENAEGAEWVYTSDSLKGDTGAAGADGADGADGEDGYSPTVAVSEIAGGHQVTITDEDGDHTFDVMDGATGAQGPQGPAGTITAYVLEWLGDSASQSEKDANAAIMAQIASATPGQFNVLIHYNSFYYPAAYYGSGYVGCFDLLGDGYVHKMISYNGGVYTQSNYPVLNTGTFDGTDTFAGASQASIADYVAGQIADNTSATTE